MILKKKARPASLGKPIKHLCGTVGFLHLQVQPTQIENIPKKKKIVSVLKNCTYSFLLSLHPKECSITTIYIILGIISNLEVS
jgi:hypothetical protein